MTDAPHRPASRFALLACALLAAATAAEARPPPTYKLEAMRAVALRALPPDEQGDFLPSDLVEVATLDSTLKLDVRYATTRNFLRWPAYTEGRVFLQRPAADALVRAHRALASHGYGLLLFDGYRPWYVTRVFWEATPPEKRAYVADPSEGSKHNRGCAIDASLFDLRTGREVPMPSDYDDFSERAHPDYAGGSAARLASRDLLRTTLEAEGFTVSPTEWWHFDCRDWARYRIENVAFKDIRSP
jgi:D-alanyl-D-alanine dipeptidase